ncbi:MAG: hypothetical protein AABY73_09160 [Pseudomonadota bacterium]
MAIKTPATLSKEDFNDALVTLRSNVSEVSRDTGIPRHLLSHFRNYGDGLKPEQLAKLLDYLEDKGIELEEVSERAEPEPKAKSVAVPQPAPHPRVAIAAVCHFPISAEHSPDAVRDVLNEVVRNDERIAELLATKAKHASGVFGQSEEFSDQTQEDIRELFALLGANYVLVRYLTGTGNPLERVAASDTLQAVMFGAIRESIERAGLGERLLEADAESKHDEAEATA